MKTVNYHSSDSFQSQSIQPIQFILLMAVLSLSGYTPKVDAQTTYYYDEDDTVAGWGSPNLTAWNDIVGTYWSTDPTGSSATSLWPNSPLDTMSFGSNVTAWNFAGTQTITLLGTINAAGIDTWLAHPTSGFQQPLFLQGGTIDAGTSTFLIRPQVGAAPNAAAQNMRIDSVIDGSGGLTLDTTIGTRNVNAETRLGGNNTYTGVTTVRRSTLALYNDNSLGAAGLGNHTVIEANGRVLLAGLNATATPITVDEDFRIQTQDANAANTVSIRSSNANNVINGDITFVTGNSSAAGDNDRGINVNTNHTLTINGNVTTELGGSANNPRILLSVNGGSTSRILINGDMSEGVGTTMRLLIDGSTTTPASNGVVELAGNNSFTGATTIRRGTLLLSSPTALGSSTQVFIADGGLGNPGNTLSLLTNGPYTFTQNISINNASGTTTYTAVIGGNSAHTSTFSGQITINDTNAGTYQLTAAAGGQVNFTGLITDGAQTKLIEKTGAGVVNLARAAGNTYDGGTLVSAGTLLVNNTSGSATGTGTVTINSGATLGGEGIISGSVTVNGSVAPGNSGIGTLTVNNNVTWNAGNSWVFELGTAQPTLALANVGGTRDLLDINGNFLRGTGSSWNFDFANTGSLGWYKIVDWTGITDFVPADFTFTNLAPSLSAVFHIDPTTSALYVEVIPEPGTLLTLVLAFLAVYFIRRKKAAQKS